MLKLVNLFTNSYINNTPLHRSFHHHAHDVIHKPRPLIRIYGPLSDCAFLKVWAGLGYRFLLFPERKARVDCRSKSFSGQKYVKPLQRGRMIDVTPCQLIKRIVYTSVLSQIIGPAPLADETRSAYRDKTAVVAVLR